MSQSRAMTDPETPYRTPRWVKLFGVIIVVLALLAGIIMLAGGEHGPGRHVPSGDTGGSPTVTGLTGGHTSPEQHSGSHP